MEALTDTYTEEQSHIRDRDLAGLLQAVTSAAGQESNRNTATGRTRMMTQAIQNFQEASNAVSNLEASSRRRKGGSGEAHHSQDEIIVPQAAPQVERNKAQPNPRKRKRVSGPSHTVADTTVIGGSAAGEDVYGLENIRDDDEAEVDEQTSQLALSDARAAGVHSAAALFRRPSASSKKYTRPPMSKLFGSLELSPENFLHLQAAAKAYMLDPKHPDRQSCVGNRGKADTDMVRLRLYTCVKDFLELEGQGERFFGENAMPGGPNGRRLIWPTHSALVISAVTPLLRRMVTNERQRQYAVETRKGTPSTGRKSTKESSLAAQNSPSTGSQYGNERNLAPYPSSKNIFEASQDGYDPSLGGEESNSGTPRAAKRHKRLSGPTSLRDSDFNIEKNGDLSQHHAASPDMQPDNEIFVAVKTPLPPNNVTLHVSILTSSSQANRSGHRSFRLRSADEAPTFDDFLHIISTYTTTDKSTTVDSSKDAVDSQARPVPPSARANPAKSRQTRPRRTRRSSPGSNEISGSDASDDGINSGGDGEAEDDEMMDNDDNVTSASGPRQPHTECLLETGLVEIADDNEYQSALSTVLATVWMERVLKVIVRV